MDTHIQFSKINIFPRWGETIEYIEVILYVKHSAKDFLLSFQ